MDVRCARCGTEYEFDDTLLTSAGIAVRCSECDHAFRVAPDGVASTGWTVRRDDGIRVEVTSLNDLCRRIRSGELAEHDAISRAGDFEWKPLGTIAELRESFDDARTHRKPRPAAMNEESAREQTVRRGPTTSVRPPASLPPPDRAPSVPPVRGAPAEPLATTPTSGVPTLLGLPGSESPSASRSERPGTTIPSGRPHLTLVLTVDEDEPVPAVRSTALLSFVFTLVVLAAAGGGVLAYRHLAATRAEERIRDLEQTARPLSLDTAEAYRTTCEALTAEHAVNPDDAGPLTLVATCHARWAQSLLDEATFEEDPGRGDALRRLATEHAEEANRFATRATEVAPRSAEAHIARADAARLLDQTDRTSAELRTASSLGGAVSAESLRVAAEVAASRAGNSAAAEADAERAAALDPSDARIVVLLARVAVARRDLVSLDARRARLVEVSPSHHGVRYLALARARLEPPDASVSSTDGVRR